MRNYSSLTKHLSCVIVRKCVYALILSALQTKHLLLTKNASRYSTTLSTHPRTITHDSPASMGRKARAPRRRGNSKPMPEKNI
jgi:hypothetical protein